MIVGQGGQQEQKEIYYHRQANLAKTWKDFKAFL